MGRAPDRIVGRRPVAEALEAGVPLVRVLIAEGKHPGAERLVERARARGVDVVVVPKRRLDDLSAGVAHQGIVAEAPPYRYVSLEALIWASSRGPEERGRVSRRAAPEGAPALYPPALVLADQITDPHNIGALLRAMDAVGAAGLILGRRRSASVTPAVHKASAGAVEHVPVAQVTNVAQALETLKARGLWAVGLAEDGTVDLYEADLEGPLVLAVGAEGAGLSRLVRERCDTTVLIPMAGRLSSLNVAQAAAVVLFERARRARAGTPSAARDTPG